MSVEDMPQRLNVNREGKVTHDRPLGDSTKTKDLALTMANVFVFLLCGNSTTHNSLRYLFFSVWILRLKELFFHVHEMYSYLRKGYQVEHLLCYIILYVMPSLPMIDPSCPNLKNYEQLLKKQADWGQGYHLSCRLPERIFAWCRVTTCDYKVRAQGIDKMKTCYRQPCDLFSV